METEKVVIAEIYKKDGKTHIQCDELETHILELMGFLKCYVNALEQVYTEEMIDSMEK